MKIPLTLAVILAVASASHAATKLDPQIAAFLERSNPVYEKPMDRGLQGIPIGNGSLGTMVWTPLDEGGVVYQLNRVDSWAADNVPGFNPYYLNTLPSLARLVVRPLLPLPESITPFEASLSMGDATARTRVGEGKEAFTSASFVSATRPVMVVELRDGRPGSKGFSAALGQWRAPIDPGLSTRVQSLYGGGKYPGDGPRVEQIDGDAVVSEIFQTKTHYLEFAVAMGTMDAKATLRQDDSRSIWVEFAPSGDGSAVLLSAVVVSDDPAVSAIELARKELADARAQGLAGLQQENQAWWVNFWNGIGTYVSLESPDGLANFLESVWFGNLYQTAITSRGVNPPKFNGSIFLADMDLRVWGGPLWTWNTESMYFPLFAQNAIHLIDPFYNMYWRNLPAAQENARDLWDAEGAWYAENAVYYEKLLERTPEQIAMERKKRLEEPVFSFTSHLMTGAAEISWMFYKKYDYLGDEQWLRDRAYPLMKETAAFYMSYFQKGEDGKYFIYPSNAHEAWFGVRNSIMDLAAVRWLMPRLIAASEKLELDAEKRPKWQEFLDNQPPYPTMDMPTASELAPKLPEDTYAPGLMGPKTVVNVQNGEAVRVTPTWPFEDIVPGRAPEEDLERMRRTLLSETFGNPITWMGYPGWSRTPIMAARLGMKDTFKTMLIRSAVFARQEQMLIGLDHENGLVRGEASQLVTTAINDALLQSHNGLIQLFYGWPDEWNARFRLLAEGNFFVEAEIRDGGRIFAALEPRADGKATVVNPWPGQKVRLQSGGKTTLLEGERFNLQLKRGEKLVLMPETSALTAVPPAAVDPDKSMVFNWHRDPKTEEILPRSLSMLGDPIDRTVTPVGFGPFTPASQEEIDQHFLINAGHGYYGVNIPLTNRAVFSANPPGIQMEFPPGAQGNLYAAFVNEAGKDESILVNGFTAEADFTPTATPYFGFFFKQRNLYGSGAYFAAIGTSRSVYPKTSSDKGALFFGRTLPSGNLPMALQQVLPFESDIESGVTYRVRLVVKPVNGLPMRYADATLSVAKASDPGTPLGSTTFRLNLSNDNMPDIGQFGLYVYGGFPPSTETASGVVIDNISFQSKHD